jgi:hypothetical protein
VGLHSLRHSSASVLLTHGVPVKVVSEILGHSSAAMPEACVRAVRVAILTTMVSRVLHLSPVGCGSPTTVPLAAGTTAPSGVKPCVWPETRWRAPGVDGPNAVVTCGQPAVGANAAENR